MIQIGRIGFLGGGKIAQAMVKGFLANGLTKTENLAVSLHPSDSQNIKSLQDMGIETSVTNIPVVERSDVLFVAVKPNIILRVLEEVRPVSAGKLFISVAMGINLKNIEKHLSQQSRVIRAMPNTPSLVQQGCSVFVRGANTTDGDAKLAETLLRAIGTCEEVDESLIDPITALSGSGPAYVFVMIEALADGAVKMGLPRDLAYRLASQTVMGSGKLVRDTKIHPGCLKDDVTSPGGSTAFGLRHLEQTGFRSSIAGAVEAATKRCREISGSLK